VRRDVLGQDSRLLLLHGCTGPFSLGTPCSCLSLVGLPQSCEQPPARVVSGAQLVAAPLEMPGPWRVLLAPRSRALVPVLGVNGRLSAPANIRASRWRARRLRVPIRADSRVPSRTVCFYIYTNIYFHNTSSFGAA
jgi:hypothetical protein